MIDGWQSRPAHSRIFPSCFARWFALRANSKNAAIIAHAPAYARAGLYVAAIAAMDSRSRENDEAGGNGHINFLRKNGIV